MTQRLKEWIRTQGLSTRAFEQSIGASDGLIRRAITAQTDIQCKWLTSMAKVYPTLNLEWLLTGSGMMSKPKNIRTTIRGCSRCKEKDQMIQSLRMENEAQSLLIASYRQQIRQLRKKLKLT